MTWKFGDIPWIYFGGPGGPNLRRVNPYTGVVAQTIGTFPETVTGLACNPEQEVFVGRSSNDLRKYTSTGSMAWERGTWPFPVNCVTVDGFGNSFGGNGGSPCEVRKYSPTGVLQWTYDDFVFSVGGFYEFLVSILARADGYLYLLVRTQIGGGGLLGTELRLIDPDGDEVWRDRTPFAERPDDTSGDPYDTPYHMTIDENGDLYILCFRSNVSPGGLSIFKLSPALVQIWHRLGNYREGQTYTSGTPRSRGIAVGKKYVGLAVGQWSLAIDREDASGTADSDYYWAKYQSFQSPLGGSPGVGGDAPPHAPGYDVYGYQYYAGGNGSNIVAMDKEPDPDPALAFNNGVRLWGTDVTSGHYDRIAVMPGILGTFPDAWVIPPNALTLEDMGTFMRAEWASDPGTYTLQRERYLEPGDPP